MAKKSVVASTNSAAAAFGSPGGKGPLKGNKMKSPPFSSKDRDIQASILAAVDEVSAAAPTTAQAAEHFSAESMHDRLRMYAQQGALPLEFLDRYVASKKQSNTVGSSDGNQHQHQHHEE